MEATCHGQNLPVEDHLNSSSADVAQSKWWLFGFRGGERSASDWLVSLAVK
jgi:hypothetical protein